MREDEQVCQKDGKESRQTAVRMYEKEILSENVKKEIFPK